MPNASFISTNTPLWGISVIDERPAQRGFREAVSLGLSQAYRRSFTRRATPGVSMQPEEAANAAASAVTRYALYSRRSVSTTAP